MKRLYYVGPLSGVEVQWGAHAGLVVKHKDRGGEPGEFPDEVANNLLRQEPKSWEPADEGDEEL